MACRGIDGGKRVSEPGSSKARVLAVDGGEAMRSIGEPLGYTLFPDQALLERVREVCLEHGYPPPEVDTENESSPKLCWPAAEVQWHQPDSLNGKPFAAAAVNFVSYVELKPWQQLLTVLLGAAATQERSLSGVFSPLEFLAELSCHIPRVFEQTTRYFGAYSPRTRGAKRRDERFQKLLENNFEPLEHSATRRAPSQSWARCMKLVFEVDPLLCPKCGSEMKIKSFIPLYP